MAADKEGTLADSEVCPSPPKEPVATTALPLPIDTESRSTSKKIMGNMVKSGLR